MILAILWQVGTLQYIQLLKRNFINFRMFGQVMVIGELRGLKVFSRSVLKRPWMRKFSDAFLLGVLKVSVEVFKIVLMLQDCENRP